MSRPKKRRRVCCLPELNSFGPLKGPLAQGESIAMTVDEYETIRLLDMEGFTQEECAEQMNIARSTVQGIYAQARKKMAQCLVEGRVLRIEGGDYKLCHGQGERCGRGGCCRNRHGQRD